MAGDATPIVDMHGIERIYRPSGSSGSSGSRHRSRPADAGSAGPDHGQPEGSGGLGLSIVAAIVFAVSYDGDAAWIAGIAVRMCPSTMKSAIVSASMRELSAATMPALSFELENIEHRIPVRRALLFISMAPRFF